MFINLETSEKVFLEPHLTDFQTSPIKSSTSAEAIAITYEIGIPSELMGSSEGTSDVQSFLFPGRVYATEQKYKCDSTSSVCATLTFYYQDGTQGGVDYMYMEKVRNIWTRQDPQVTWSSGRIKGTCTCFAEWLDRAGYCNTTVTGSVSNPVSGAAYEIVPWFAGSNNKTLVDDLSNFQVAAQEITLHRGGSSWNFSLCIVNGGGSSVYGCY